MAFSLSFASRRTLRMATRASSAYLPTVLASCLRRSSVRLGMMSRTTLPSDDGVMARSDLWMAFSMFPICDASQGWMTMVLGSGTDTDASWLIGVMLPYASTRILSSSAALARPVRTPENSRASRSVAACMRASRSLMRSCIALPPRWCGVVGDDRAHRLTGDDAPDVAPPGEIEHHDGELVVHAERDGRRVHHRQSPVERFDVADAGELHRLRVLGRIGRVDTVHLGGLQEDLGSDLHRPEGARRVRGEERIARARGEHDHAALLEVPDGAPANVGLRHRPHLDGGQHTRGHAGLLDRVLEREGVDDGGQHAHVVAGRAVHTARAGRDAAEDVPAPDDHGHLDAHADHLADLLRDTTDRLRLDPVGLPSGQRLAGELEQDAAVDGRPGFGHGASPRPPGSARSA